MKINKWTITDITALNKWGTKEYLCICECGQQQYHQITTIVQNRSKGCMNCTRTPINKKYGKWTIIGGPERNKHKQLSYRVKCDCGYERNVRKWSLILGSTTRCNYCAFREKPKRALKHGLAGTKIYRAWCDMKSRCINKEHKYYERYGGRGIKICKRWYNFVCFLKDMGPIPFGMQLGRKDVNKDYTPHNTIWTTARENMRNRTNSRQQKST